MKKLFLLAVVTFFIIPAFAQVPQPALLSVKTIGGNADDGITNRITKTQDGGFILNVGSVSTFGTGTIDSFCNLSGYRGIFLKYNADGSTLEWSKCYKWDGDTIFYYPFPQSDGSIVFGGNYNSESGWGVYVCKQDADGNGLWSKGFSKGTSLSPTCMIATDDGGYLLAGGSFYVDTNIDKHYGDFTTADIFVLKLDGDGNKVWCKVFGGTNDDIVKKVIPDLTGGYYIVGATNSNDFDCTGSHGIPDGYIARLDKNGNMLWHRDIGGTSGDGFIDGVLSNKGGLILVGATFSSNGDVAHYKGPYRDIWLMEADSDGSIIWENSYDWGGDESCFAVCRAADGSIWIAAATPGSQGEGIITNGKEDALFMHTDSAGKLLNARMMGSGATDIGTMVWPIANGNVMAGGIYGDGCELFKSYYGSNDVFLALLGPGNQTGITPVSTFSHEVKVYPNPAEGMITVRTRKQGTLHLAIRDATGRLVHQSDFTGRVQVTAHDWARGAYYVQVTADDGDGAFTTSLVKN